MGWVINNQKLLQPVLVFYVKPSGMVLTTLFHSQKGLKPVWSSGTSQFTS